MGDEKVTVRYDAGNEQAVLSAAIADREVRRQVVRRFGADAFLGADHGAIARALRKMEDRGLEYDPRTMRQLLAGESLSDLAYLELLERTARVPANLAYHLESLEWDQARAIVARGALSELVDALADPATNPERVQSLARGVAKGLEGKGGRRYVRAPEQLRRSYMADLHTRRASPGIWTTGWEGMDAQLSYGIAPEKTWLVAGLSGSGKSTWIASLVKNLAREGRRVLYGAWEMGAESTIDLFASSMTHVELDRILAGRLSEEEVERVERVVGWLLERVVFMENPFFDRQHVEARGRGRPDNHRNLDVLEGYLAESGCDVLVCDLWDRLLVDMSYEGVTSALYRQQRMHQEYGVCGILAVQLRGKDVEKRRDKRPTREAIKGVGGYVEVADVIVGVHREAQFKMVPDDSIEAICLKQRKGRANWAVRHDWRGDLALVAGEGEEIPFDPGLEGASETLGGVEDIKIGRPKRGKAGKERRDG